MSDDYSIDQIKVMLDCDADINVKCRDDHINQKNTALAWAIADGCATKALWLINYGRSYNIDFSILSYGHTALHLAITKGYEHLTTEDAKRAEQDKENTPQLYRQIVKRLIEEVNIDGHGIDVKEIKYGYTPLHLAVMRRDLEVVQWLLEAEANIYITDNKNNPPLKLLDTSLKEVENFLYSRCHFYTLNKNDWNKRGYDISSLIRQHAVKHPHLQELADNDYPFSELDNSNNNNNRNRNPVKAVLHEQNHEQNNELVPLVGVNKINHYRLKFFAPPTASTVVLTAGLATLIAALTLPLVLSTIILGSCIAAVGVMLLTASLAYSAHLKSLSQKIDIPNYVLT